MYATIAITVPLLTMKLHRLVMNNLDYLLKEHPLEQVKNQYLKTRIRNTKKPLNGPLLLSIRKALCLTQKEFSIKIGINESGYCVWESGGRIPNEKHRRKIINIIEVIL